MLTLKIILFSYLLLALGSLMIYDSFIPGYIVLFIGIVGVIASPFIALMIKEDM